MRGDAVIEQAVDGSFASVYTLGCFLQISDCTIRFLGCLFQSAENFLCIGRDIAAVDQLTEVALSVVDFFTNSVDIRESDI